MILPFPLYFAAFLIHFRIVFIYFEICQEKISIVFFFYFNIHMN